VIGLWLTHGHFDHVADHAVVSARFPRARVMIHALDEPKIDGTEPQLFALPFSIPARKADGHLSDGQVLRIGAIEVHVMHTPGHCAGHVVFHFPVEQIVVGGDLIIGGSIGRTDLPDSSFATLQESVRRVMALPDETRLLPGHGAVSTLRQELQSNCYVQEILAAEG
jgi:glyoxylase-like metal-dependent hydrolase (beta-lactamase superfamily II)